MHRKVTGTLVKVGEVLSNTVLFNFASMYRL